MVIVVQHTAQQKHLSTSNKTHKFTCVYTVKKKKMKLKSRTKTSGNRKKIIKDLGITVMKNNKRRISKQKAAEQSQNKYFIFPENFQPV